MSCMCDSDDISILSLFFISYYYTMAESGSRMSAGEVLSMPFFSEYHDPSTEPTAPMLFHVEDAPREADEWKALLFAELADYAHSHPQ